MKLIFYSMGSGFRDTIMRDTTFTIFNIPYLGMKPRIWKQFQKLRLDHIFYYPKMLKLNLFSLYGQQLPRYRPIIKSFKIFIFGHETLGIWKKFQMLHMMHTLSTPGVKIELIFALWAAVSEIQADFQNCHIRWHETWNVKKVPGGAYYCLKWGEIELIFTLWPTVSEIVLFFKIAIPVFGYGTWILKKVPEVA